MKRLQAMFEAEVSMDHDHDHETDDGRKSPNSGDEGDDEMDGDSPGGYHEGLSAPPPVPPKWTGPIVEDKMRWGDAWGAGMMGAIEAVDPDEVIKMEPGISKPVPLSPFLPHPMATLPPTAEKGKEKEVLVKEEKNATGSPATSPGVLRPQDVKQENQHGYFVM